MDAYLLVHLDTLYVRRGAEFTLANGSAEGGGELTQCFAPVQYASPPPRFAEI